MCACVRGVCVCAMCAVFSRACVCAPSCVSRSGGGFSAVKFYWHEIPISGKRIGVVCGGLVTSRNSNLCDGS